MKAVLRTIAIAALLLLACDAVVPLFATNLDSALPACCRRDGKHQCSMMAQASNTDGTPQLAPTRCASFSKRTTAAKSPRLQAPALRSVVASIYSHPAAKAQTEARYRTSHSRARDKRGPPPAA